MWMCLPECMYTLCPQRQSSGPKFSPQYQCKKLDMRVCDYNPSSGGVESGRPVGFGGQSACLLDKFQIS